MTGYEPGELIGKNLHARIHHSEADGSPYSVTTCAICNSVKNGCCVNVRDEILWRKDGSKFPAEYTGNPIFTDGSIAILRLGKMPKKSLGQPLQKKRPCCRSCTIAPATLCRLSVP